MEWKKLRETVEGTLAAWPRRFPLIACVAIILLCGYVPSSAADTSAAEPTEKEISAAYESLSAKDRQTVDEFSADERRVVLRSRAIQARLDVESGRATQKGLLKPGDRIHTSLPLTYVVDPLLKQAFDAYLDESVPSEEAIRLFTLYIEKNPKSEFLPEVYFRIGAAYSMHSRPSKKVRLDLAWKYFGKAHELYGSKFSYAHITAWASLANRAKAPLEFRMKYYEWLLQLAEEASVENMYPYRQIEQTFNGRSPKIGQDEMKYILSGMRRNLPNFIKSAEKTIIWRVSKKPYLLSVLSSRYPNSKLGNMARQKLMAMASRGVSPIDDPAFLQPYKGSGDADPNGTPRSPASEAPSKDLPTSADESATSPRWTLPVFLGVGVVALLLVLRLCRHRRVFP